MPELAPVMTMTLSRTDSDTLASLALDRDLPDGGPGEAEIAAAGPLLQCDNVAGIWICGIRGFPGSRRPIRVASR
jgi:hypothetical protein